MQHGHGHGSKSQKETLSSLSLWFVRSDLIVPAFAGGVDVDVTSPSSTRHGTGARILAVWMAGNKCHAREG